MEFEPKTPTTKGPHSLGDHVTDEEYGAVPTDRRG